MQSSQLRYKVRAGTIDLGKEYEFKMATLLSLRCVLRNKKDWWVAFNVDGVGDFDDIIIHQAEVTCMLQLKHKDSPKHIMEKEFLAPIKGDFSLEKYSRDILSLKEVVESKIEKSGIVRKLEKFDNIYFVLYTNRGVYDCDLLGENCDTSAVSFLNTGSDSDVFKFDFTNLPSINSSYCSNFYLLPNQVHAKTIDETIAEEINKILPVNPSDSKNIAEKFLKYITEWAKGDLGGHYCLTRQDVILKLTELFVSRFEVNLQQEMFTFYDSHNVKQIWNKIIEERTVTVVDSDSAVLSFLFEFIGSEVGHCFTGPERETWTYTLSDQEQSMFYQRNENLKIQMLKIVGNRGKITLFDIYKCLWMTQKLPLLLKVNKPRDCDAIVKVLELSNYCYKVIILKNSSESFSLPEVSHLETLQDLSEENREKILDLAVKLQGRPGATLSELIDEDMFEYVKSRDIIAILLNDFNIGDELDSLPKYYIERTLLDVVTIEAKVLTEVKNEIFFIEDLKCYFNILSMGKLDFCKLEEVDFSCVNSHWIIVSSNKVSCEEIERLKTWQKPVHHLTIQDSNHLQWIKSFGSIGNIKRFQVGLRLGNNITNHFSSTCNPTTVVSAVPGMGKSILMDYVAHRAPTDKWVLRVDLNKHLQYYKSDDCRNTSTKALKHLRYFKNALLTNHICNVNLANAIFEKLARLRDVVILLDGFDEISISYKEEVTNIAKTLHEEGYQMFLTTRPFMKLHLEEHFNTFAVTLTPFTDGNQENFLMAYFSIANSDLVANPSVDMRPFVKSLLSETQKNFYDWDAEFTKIPLHVKLLADAFNDNCRSYMQGVTNSVDSSCFDVLRLYQNFIDKKNDILCQKFGPGAEDTCKLFIKYQKFFALKIIFPQHEAMLTSVNNGEDLYKSCKNDSNLIQLLQREGVVIIDERLNVDFVHRTFTEYLAAQWLSENVNSDDKKVKQVARILIEERFTHNYKFLFNIFDRFITKGCSLHLAIINGQTDEAKNIISADLGDVAKLDKCGRSIFHIIALYGVRYLFSRGLSDTDSSILLLGHTDKTLEIFKLILDKNLEIQEDFLGYNPLDYALARRCLTIANAICEKWKSPIVNVNITLESKKDFLGYCAVFDYKALFDVLLPYFAYRDLLLRNVTKYQIVEYYFRQVFKSKKFENYAAEFKNTSIVELLEGTDSYKLDLRYAIISGSKSNVEVLLSKGAQINNHDVFGNAPLYYAVLHAQWDIVVLLSKVLDINVQDGAGNTPLHWALLAIPEDKEKNKEIVKLFLSRGADVNATNKQGDSCLHLLFQLCYSDILSDILSSNSIRADVNLKTKKGGDTILHCAVNIKDISIVEKVLSKGALTNEPNDKGDTALHLATKKGLLNIVELLFSKGACAKIQNLEGNTALHCAVQIDDIDITRKLLSGDVLINERNYDGNTALHIASIEGNLEMVNMLLSKWAEVDVKNREGRTAVHEAASRCHYLTVKKFIDSGKVSCINDRDFEDNTVLHFSLMTPFKRSYRGTERSNLFRDLERRRFYKRKFGSSLEEENDKSLESDDEYEALREPQIYIAKLAISRGADVNARNQRGKTVLEYALDNGFYEIIPEILNNGGKTDKYSKNSSPLLHLLLSNGQVRVAMLALSAGVDPNMKNKLEETALHCAVRQRSYVFVKEILAKGVGVNEKNDEGNTALHLASADGQLEIVNLLISNGADLNIENLEDHTALHVAFTHDRLEIVTELLRHPNLNVNAVLDTTGRTAVHYVVEKNLKEALKIILDRDVDVYKRNNDGNTALHLAVEKNYAEIVEILLDHEPDIEIKNNKGKTAYFLAHEKGDDKVIYLFQNYAVRLPLPQVHIEY